jgi:hypothetical protein
MSLGTFPLEDTLWRIHDSFFRIGSNVVPMDIYGTRHIELYFRKNVGSIHEPKLWPYCGHYDGGSVV